jgi:AraC-like DNA-binding protein
MKKPTISVAATTGFIDALADADADPDAVIESVGLKHAVLQKPDAFVPAAAFTRMLEEAAHTTRDDCFGLHFGDRFDPKDIGALAYVVLNSPTVALAMQNIERYVKIHNNAGRASFAIENDGAHLTYVVTNEPQLPRRQHNEYSMAVLLRTFRIIAGDDWRPREVGFEHDAPGDMAEHSRVFRCPVRFGCAANELVVEHDFIQRLVPLADVRLYRILKQHVERILAELPGDDDWLSVVRNAIAAAILEGDPKRMRVARRLAISTRTLERRLNEHGVVYRQLVDDTRRVFAMEYLEDRNQSLTEIAFLLGYSEVSAFHRAFRRWTGSTPSEYREQHAR